MGLSSSRMAREERMRHRVDLSGLPATRQSAEEAERVARQHPESLRAQVDRLHGAWMELVRAIRQALPAWLAKSEPS